jgi:hypothetical protein
VAREVVVARLRRPAGLNQEHLRPQNFANHAVRIIHDLPQNTPAIVGTANQLGKRLLIDLALNCR